MLAKLKKYGPSAALLCAGVGLGLVIATTAAGAAVVQKIAAARSSAGV